MKHFLRLVPVAEPIFKKTHYFLPYLDQRSLEGCIVRLGTVAVPNPS
ncbi:unnamed protein product [Ciceribacter sp. T2.26MG-112.2]|nr:unnamed protein product [Ciceribacter naphthalenivorans]